MEGGGRNVPLSYYLWCLHFGQLYAYMYQLYLVLNLSLFFGHIVGMILSAGGGRRCTVSAEAKNSPLLASSRFTLF